MFRKSKIKTLKASLSGANQGEIRLSLPSCIGYERVAMEAAATMARMMGFAPSRVDDLRTAVSETCINAIEHGNKLDAAKRVEVCIRPDAQNLFVQIFDNGAGFKSNLPPAPQIEKKIRGEENPRGWGLFLITHLVDHVEFKATPKLGHVTTLTMRLD